MAKTLSSFSGTPNTSNYPRSNRKKRGGATNTIRKTKPRPAKWKFLQHNGPFFPPPFQPLPDAVKLVYGNQRIKLSPESEEAAILYVKVAKNHKDEMFNANFFADWKELMTEEEKSVITEWNLCNFRHINNYLASQGKYEKQSEIQLKKRREIEADVKKRYGFCDVDGVVHEAINFKIKTDLFQARGEHPRRGKIRMGVAPEDITINCSEDSKIPKAPEGHCWKSVVHDNTGLWLAKWTDNLQKQHYIKLKPSSKSNEQQEKFNTAKKLSTIIESVRNDSFEGMKSEDMIVRQRSIALFFIDNFGLRTGFDKYEDEADTVGCCSLRVQHLTLRDNIVTFDFLGKSSVRYYNEVEVDPIIFKNLQLFQDGKEPEDKLFDLLTPIELNNYLSTIMEGLTAKVFRTYNASHLFKTFLEVFTDEDSAADEKIRCYKSANAVIALLLNHRTFATEDTEFQVNNVRKEMREVLEELKRFPEGIHCEHNVKARRLLHNLKELLTKKTLLLNTSKVHYLDPRITVEWCRKNNIDIGRVYTETQMKNFKWVIDKKNFERSSKKRNTLISMTDLNF